MGGLIENRFHLGEEIGKTGIRESYDVESAEETCTGRGAIGGTGGTSKSDQGHLFLMYISLTFFFFLVNL